MSGDRELDVVVFGATGFAGRLVAGYLAGHAPAGVRIGLAGRSQRRLAEVRARLGAAASGWPLLVADSADPVSLAALARAAQVVLTTVGPYRARGLALVQACAEAGTDYADLTGEVLFVRDSIDRCHDAAASSGARIVHCCGFDSVPSDLGVLGLHHAARVGGAGDLLGTTLIVRAMRGGLSGGTVASMMGQLDEVRASAECRRLVSDPYALSPDRAAEPGLGGERDLDRARYDGGLRMWTGPWVMAGINTRVVRRSNALQGWAYGRRFRYREVTGFGAGPAAAALAAAASAGTKAAQAGLAFGPSRELLRRILPAPGRGPGEKTRRTGFFRIQIHAQTSAGARYLGAIEAQGDPGYAATSVMLGETGLCLALDKDQLPDRAGVLTPATAMGAALATRLRSAGHTLTTRQITSLPATPTLWLVSLCGREPHSPRVPQSGQQRTDGDATRSGSHHSDGRSRPVSGRSRRLRCGLVRKCAWPTSVGGYRWGVTELFHITERAAWLQAVPAREYRMSTRGVTLEEQGYIHCSLRHQLRGVAELVYGDSDDLVVLVIDSAKVPAPVRYEAPGPGAEEYPHIYGALPVDAVTGVLTVRRDSAQPLTLPE